MDGVTRESGMTEQLAQHSGLHVTDQVLIFQPTSDFICRSINPINCILSWEAHFLLCSPDSVPSSYFLTVSLAATSCPLGSPIYLSINVRMPKVQASPYIVCIHGLSDHNQFHKLKYHLYAHKLISLAQFSLQESRLKSI